MVQILSTRMPLAPLPTWEETLLTTPTRPIPAQMFSGIQLDLNAQYHNEEILNLKPDHLIENGYFPIIMWKLILSFNDTPMGFILTSDILKRSRFRLQRLVGRKHRKFTAILLVLNETQYIHVMLGNFIFIKIIRVDDRLRLNLNLL